MVRELPRLRFADSALERAFLTEYADVDPFRYRVIWSVALVSIVVLAWVTPGTPSEVSIVHRAPFFSDMPVTALALSLGFAPRRIFVRAWQVASAIAGGSVSAVVPICFTWIALQSHGHVSAAACDYGATILAMVVLSLFTVLSLRTVYAAIACAIPIAAELVIIATVSLDRAIVARLCSIVFSAVIVGAVGSVQLERLRRTDFLRRHELAAERAKTEELLKREIGHQVAVRSKELGDNLLKLGAAADVVAPQPGDRFDARYRVIRQLGAGGMGAVYEVERLTDGAHLALKIMLGQVSGAIAARFAREAEIGARVRHPHVVPIVDVGVTATGTPFLIMELVRGGSVEGQRERFGDVAWARGVLLQVVDGLIALHATNVVHRDLKPANILVDEDGVAKISDFGISRLDPDRGAINPDAPTLEASTPRGGRLTGTGMLLGTPQYMAPEAAEAPRRPTHPWTSSRSASSPTRCWARGCRSRFRRCSSQWRISESRRRLRSASTTRSRGRFSRASRKRRPSARRSRAARSP